MNGRRVSAAVRVSIHGLMARDGYDGSAIEASVAGSWACRDLEAHYLAGGNVVKVVNAMISADKANIPLPLKRAAAIDLAGRDVLAAVQMSVIPKVIETPRIAAVAKDGIQLIAVARGLRRWVKGDAPREMEPDTPQIPPRGSRPLPPVVQPRRAREGPHSAPLPRAVPPAAARRRARSRLGSPRAVRRGIILMTILGPCRALEPPAPRA